MIGSRNNSYKFTDEKIIFFEYLLFMSYRSILFDNQSKLFYLKELDYIVELFCYDNYIDISDNIKNEFRKYDFNCGVEVLEFLR